MRTTTSFLENLESKFKEIKKAASPNHLMISVLEVKVNKLDADQFQVKGVRLDTDTPVFLRSQKSSSGQYLPEVGGVIRADKLQAIPVKDKPHLELFSAQYFHSYPSDDFCLHAVVRPSEIKPNLKTKTDTCSVTAFDVDANATEVDMADFRSIDNTLLRLLKPWSKATNASTITHDMNGKAIWSQDGTLGAVPLVVVRIPGTSAVKWITGLSAVKDEPNGPARAPTDREILNQIAKNTGLQQIKAALAQAEADDPGQLNGLKIILIPGASFNVGRDSMKGEKYLGVKNAFDYKDYQNKDAQDQPKVFRGFKSGYVHLKKAENGRLMVVDLTPALGKLTASIPETKIEIELREAAENALNSSHKPDVSPTEKTSTSSVDATNRSLSRPASGSQALPEPNADNEDFTPPSIDDFDEDMALDIAAMQSMQQPVDDDYGVDMDEEVEALLADADELAVKRRSKFQMG